MTESIEQLREELRVVLMHVADLRDDNKRLRAALHQLQGCDIDNAAQDIIIRALEPKP